MGQLDTEEAWDGSNIGYDSPILPWQDNWIACRLGGYGGGEGLGHSSLEPPLGDGWCWYEPGTQENGMAVAGQLECLHCAPTPAIKVEGVT